MASLSGGEDQQREAGGAHGGRGDGCPALRPVRVAAGERRDERPAEPEADQHRAGDDALGAAGEHDQGEDQSGRGAGGQGPGDDAGHRPGVGASVRRRRCWVAGGVDVDAHDGLALAEGGALLSSVVANGFAHPGQMAGIRTPVLGEFELGEFAARGDAGLGEHVAQVEGHGPWGDPDLGGDVLVGEPGGHELGDLELHRGELYECGGVALAGGLA